MKLAKSEQIVINLRPPSGSQPQLKCAAINWKIASHHPEEICDT